MEIKAYNSEKFNRNNRWYVWFSSAMAAIVILSILNDNIPWAVLLFFLLWGYFYYSISNNQLIKISIDKQWLIVGTKTYSRNNLSGYALEIDPKTQKIKNIVFITGKQHSIHTIGDNDQNTKNFIVSLNDYLPMVWEYEQSFLEKLARKLKL